MRILALRAAGLVLPFIHASLIKAFRSLNVDVLDLPVPNSSVNFGSLMKTALHGCQAIFILDMGVNFYFIKDLKDCQLSIRIPWIIWFVDDPEGYGFPESCDPDWTIPFCWDREIVRRNYSWGGVPLKHLPLATDPTIFSPEKTHPPCFYPGGVFAGSTAHPNEILESVALTTPGFSEDVEAIWEAYGKDFRQSLHDLVWMRVSQKINQTTDLIRSDPLCRLWVQACVYKAGMRKRREVVSQVLQPGGGVFGDERWREFVDKDLYRGRVAYGEELRKIYNRSAFILDVRQPQARTGLTQRIFDAGACGSPILTEWSSEIETLFDPADELLCFHNLEGAIEMREHYLRDPQGARRRGEKAMQRVLGHHTYRNRAIQIIQALQQFRG